MNTKNSFLQYLLLLTLSIFVSYTKTIDFNYPAVFNFGDSNSDTGNLVASGLLGNYYPNGQTYFKKPSGRYCDGRLVVDFLMNGMGLPFLNAYLESVGAPIFRSGCNFAAAGSTILPATTTLYPFSFGVQVTQFLRFKDRVQDISKSTCRKYDEYIPAQDSFEKALYMLDIGVNDLVIKFHSISFDQILASIPYILQEFEANMMKLYDEGARFFWIHNISPFGCLPRNIAQFGTDRSKLDALGCVSAQNRAARLFNLQLHALLKKVQGQYPDANVTYVDIYTIKNNLLSNYSRYGFEQPFMTCCGYGGGPLNYDIRVPCGETNVIDGRSVTANKECSDSTKYINWDGVHYTEAANQCVASQILTGKFSDSPFSYKMPYMLNLSSEKHGII